MSASPIAPHLEEVAEFALGIVKRTGLIDSDAPAPDWDSYARIQSTIEGFDVPWTTITSVMRRFFYAISAAAGPAHIVGAGTYVGFGFAWLVMGRARGRSARPLLNAVGLDIDGEATATARRNTAALDLDGVLRFEQTEAVKWLRACQDPISLLYLDIDAPSARKSGYLDVLEAARPRLSAGALIVAHDACVPLFASDFERYHEVIEHDPGLVGPVVLPLDECGVSLARVI
jgi:predicted O-methyltransferase YrrM